MSDRIAVMNEGRIEQIGTSDEIYERPQPVSWRSSSGKPTCCPPVCARSRRPDPVADVLVCVRCRAHVATR